MQFTDNVIVTIRTVSSKRSLTVNDDVYDEHNC